jgi:acyl-coenzyme A thioesterase PaaI-like protein
MQTGMDLVNAIRSGQARPPAGISTLGLDSTHEWLTTVEPGHIEMTWDVETRYFNLENAVICSWLVALADQALFFATQTLCGDGESTRMASLQLDCVRSISGGKLKIVARVIERVHDRFYCECTMSTDDGLGARVSAIVDVVV